jgi:hypothetical protein
MDVTRDCARAPLQAPFRPWQFEADSAGWPVPGIVDFHGTPAAKCINSQHASELIALLNRGAMEVVPHHPEVRLILDRWNGQLPLEVVALILGLDAKLEAMQGAAA